MKSTPRNRFENLALVQPSRFEFQFAQYPKEVPRIIPYHPNVFASDADKANSEALNPIIKSYEVGSTRVSIDLVVPEDFCDRVKWILRDDVVLAFKVNLLNADGQPVMFHSGLALRCELDTYANGHIDNELAVSDAGVTELPDFLTASLSLFELQDVRLYEKV